jgi:CYTH domain-containing protein
MGFEIEKKFLVRSIPFALNDFKKAEIIQGYIAVEKNFSEVRIRVINNKYILTIKSDRQNVRFEENCELNPNQGKNLLLFCGRRIVAKTRYFIPYHNVTIELDVFKESLSGLMLAEVEFSTLEDMHKFIPPPWLGEEVTYDERYKNKNLAIYGL